MTTEIERLREALQLVAEELADREREQPWFEKDEFSHDWKPSPGTRTVWLSEACRRAVKEALE